MKLLSLISGGIDSPVAAHLMMKKGFESQAVIFDNSPFSDKKELETAKKTIKKLTKFHNTEIKTYIVPIGNIQEEFLDNAGEDIISYSCLFSRRRMLEIAEVLAERENISGLVTGDSLGQVASQTLDNLIVTDQAISSQVYRPLLGLNKKEITEIAKEIGTYEISIGGGITCAARVEYPQTHAKIEKMEKIEGNFDPENLGEDSLEEMREEII